MIDLDAYRAAAILIRQRDDPEMYACGRVDEMIENGDVEGLGAWRKILTAIRELQKTTPNEGNGLN